MANLSHCGDEPMYKLDESVIALVRERGRRMGTWDTYNMEYGGSVRRPCFSSTLRSSW